MFSYLTNNDDRSLFEEFESLTAYRVRGLK